MAQASALTEGMNGARLRVRTPGKYIVLFGFLPVALLAIGAGYWLNQRAGSADIAALEYRKSNEGVRAAYYNLSEFLVDLAPDRNGRTAFLKLRASIALGGSDVDVAAERIAALKPAIDERLTFFLREMRPEDFEGSEGMARIKRELLRRVNLVIAPNSAEDVVIEELVIQ